MDRRHLRRLGVAVVVPLLLVLTGWAVQARFEPTLRVPGDGSMGFGMPTPEPTRFTVTTSASVCVEPGPVRVTAVRPVPGSRGLEVSDFAFYEYEPPADDSKLDRPLRETRYGTGVRDVARQCGDDRPPPFLALELHRTGPDDEVASARAFEIEYDGWRTRTVVMPVGFWLCPGSLDDPGCGPD